MSLFKRMVCRVESILGKTISFMLTPIATTNKLLLLNKVPCMHTFQITIPTIIDHIPISDCMYSIVRRFRKVEQHKTNGFY